MIIKKIFEKKSDEEVHSDFLKFSRGDFSSKYLIDAKKQKDKWVIKTGPEFVNSLVKLGLSKVKDKVAVTGVIVSTFNIKDEIKFPIKDMKQFMGIKQQVIDTEVSKNELLALMEKFPRVFYALSFSLPDFELKIKAKAPKSAKPATGGEKEKGADFCSLKTTDPSIVKELFFDYPNFTQIAIRHTIKIQEIIYPKDMKGMKPEEVREKSKRKGILVRDAEVDGVKKTTQANFEA